MELDPVKQEVVACCRRLAEKRLVAGTEGNLSARARDGGVWMTPAGVGKADVVADMLVRVDLDGAVLEGDRAPTSERFMHLEFYRQRGGVGGVAHGHPVYSTAFAAARRALPSNVLPELIATIGEVALVPYGRASSPALAEAIAPFCRSHNAFLLQNHGSLACGASLREACDRLEVVEAYARTCWAAEALGGVRPLSQTDVDALPSPRFD